MADRISCLINSYYIYIPLCLTNPLTITSTAEHWFFGCCLHSAPRHTVSSHCLSFITTRTRKCIPLSHVTLAPWRMLFAPWRNVTRNWHLVPHLTHSSAPGFEFPHLYSSACIDISPVRQFACISFSWMTPNSQGDWWTLWRPARRAERRGARRRRRRIGGWSGSRGWRRNFDGCPVHV